MSRTEIAKHGSDQAISIILCGLLHVQTAVSVHGPPTGCGSVVRQAGRTGYGLRVNRHPEPSEPVMRIQKPPRLSRAFGRSPAGALCEPFSVTTTFPGGRTTLVTVVGDIDLATVAILVECAETALRVGGPLVIDLGGVTFCSGAGLRALHRVRRRAEAAAVPLAWVVRTPAVWRVLRGTGAAGFSCYRDRADALASVG
ncbi:Uncharacterised protein [Amycolatopsis camponoti]|uniref:STAS domain-containing protein n=1 Tax=Amycolatopsis camponoti TaxID=2606593 RepID=A0A6I8LSX6_9PSEU|nr:STAS domain-containing protein [Amycolatopsis camponoti]VVJ18566.1 Uncharacterised protein [Amycolatopsis camponoti]